MTDITDLRLTVTRSADPSAGHRRRIAGIVAPYGETATRNDGRTERYAPGSFDNYLTRSDRPPVVLIDEGGVHADRTLGTEVAWENRTEGLWMEFELVDSVRSGEVAELATMGALWGMSTGFRAGTHRTEGSTIVHTGVDYLNHVQITSRPIYEQARVTDVRTKETPTMDTGTDTGTDNTGTDQAAGTDNAATDTTLAEFRSELDLLTRAVQANTAAAEQTTEAPALEDLQHRSAGHFIHDLALARSQGGELAQREARQRIESTMEQVPELRAFDATSSPTGGFAGAVPDVFMGPIVDLVRNGAPIVNAMARVGMTFALPPSGMTIHRPKMATGTSVAWEGTEGDEPAATAGTTTDITGAVKAIKGRFRLTLQAATRSNPSAIDAMLRDQAAALMSAFGASVLNGTGAINASTGELAGMLSNAGIQATGAVATFDTPSIVAALAEAEGLAWSATNRAPLFWVMHSRRFSKFRGLLDSSNRPIMNVSRSGYSTDVIGTAGTPMGGSALGGPAQPVAELMGYPVVIDNNVPTDVGGSQDLIALVGPECFELFHDPARQLQLQVPDDFQTTFGMAKLGAQLPIRPDSLVTITGAGLT